MKNILGRYVNRYEKKHRDFRHYVMIVAVLALIVFVGVNWRLHDKGISMTSDYQCGLKEHKHTEECYKKVLICGKEETDGSEGHTHTDACYEEKKTLTCDKEEHKHNADCYDEDGNLICGKEEHEHSDDCYTTEKELVCGKKESEPVEAHHHTDACYKKELVCGLKEHTHTAACYSNESADVEDKSDWEATIPELSGNWAEDIVAVAQSQLGYEESTANFKLADDGETRQGYTRYGEWYGNKYGDWSAMFASFCLNYAGIPAKTVPVNSGCTAWITELKEQKLYKTADDYKPAAGDLVFLDTDSNEKADHVGIITEVEKEDGKIVSVKAIVGDSSDKVEENTYEADGADKDVIIGYCALPENPDEKKADETDKTEAESTTATTAEEKTEAEVTTEEKATSEADATTEKAEATTEKSEEKTESTEATTAESKTEEKKTSETTTEAKGSGESTEEAEDTTAITKASKKSSKSSVSVQSTDNETDNVSVQSVSGLDMTEYVTEVQLYKKVGQLWEESSEFTTSDSVKAEISFANVPKSEWKNNNNTAYIRLPDGFDCSKFAGETYKAYDGNTQSGTYTYEQDADGHWCIVLKLFDDYVDSVPDGANIGGKVDLEYQWDESASSEDGKKDNITIGKWTGEVTVKDDKKQDTDESGANFSISKDAGSLTYSSDGKTAYITYTVTLTVKKDMKAPINLTDNLTGNNWEYDPDSLVLANTTSGDSPAVSWNSNQEGDNNADKKSTISIGKDGETVKAGTYTFTYRVKNTKISDTTVVDSSNVHNKVSVPDKDKTISSEKWTNTTTGKVNKNGTLVTGEDGNTYIDYTVYLNAGDIIKDLTEGAKFTDTLPDDLELVGDVTVKQYDVTGKEQSTSKAQVDGQKISYTTPTGQYYYVITYRTKVKSENIPIGGKPIKNTGNSEGGISGSDSSTVTVTNPVVSKQFNSQNVTKDENGNWINKMKWTSTINVEGSLKDYVYEDWGQTAWINNKHVAIISMSEEQRNSIKIFDKDGNEIKSGYSIEDSDHQDNGVNNGLFKIKFTEAVNGPVTIQYETTADLSGYTVGTWMAFTNYASLTDGEGHTDKSQATSNNIQYTHGNPDIIEKKGNGYESGDSGSTTLKPGETSIPWTITVNKNQDKTIKGDLVITDTIADGMSFIESSLDVKIWSSSIKSSIEYSYDEETRTLTIRVPEDVYHGNNNGQEYSNPITISYRTELPKDYLAGSDLTKKFTNTASVDINGEITDSSFTQEVTRQVVGKSGKYDSTTKILTYEMILNPDASKLNDGNSLKVKDTLDMKGLKGHIQLKSLKLFTALKTTDSNGSTKVEPGKLVKVLTESDSKEDFNYQWDKDTGIFTTYIPDEKAYVLIAEYSVDASVSEAVSLSNTVELIGSQKWSADDNSTTVSKDSSGETYTEGDSLAIVKHDTDQYNTLLNGAKFKLEKYENGTWTEVATMITGKSSTGKDGETGKAYTGVDRKVLYRLTETEAPDKYDLDTTPEYFVLVTEGDTFDVPDTISGDSQYKKDKVTTYKVEKGEKKYTEITLDRYNTRDKTLVEKGQLRVNKVWIDSAGKQIEDPIRLSNLEAKVTLTKHKRQGYKIILTCNGQPYKTFITGINDGAYVFIKAAEWIGTNWSEAKLPDGVSFSRMQENASDGTPIYKIGPITSDTKIVSEKVYWNPGTFEKQEGGKESIETTSETVTLNSENDWSHLWSDLESGDDITYTLTEESVDGYKTTYQLNSKNLEENKDFSLGTNGDKVTVTNTSDSSYTLPKTGGSGTLPFITGGAFLMGFALLSGYSMRRRCGRRGE